MTYDACVKALLESPRFGQKNGLENMRHLIDILDLNLTQYKFIHVAGTNGKGSVCSMLATMFKEEGIRTGLFTSPHLVKVNERFKVDMEDVKDNDFAKACSKVAEAAKVMEEENTGSPTFFEWMLAVGLVIFEQAQVKWIILETGLGGRFDATNAIADKEVAVITKLGLDHTQYLGDSIEEIASEKAGIIKTGRPVVLWDGDEEATGVVRNLCKKSAAPLFMVDKTSYIVDVLNEDGVDFFYKNKYYNGIRLKLINPVEYMLENACIALETAAVLKPVLSVRSVRKGLERFRWPGRMEWVGNILLDGAHNMEGIEALCKALDVIGNTRKVELLFGCMKDKAYMDMVGHLAVSKEVSKVRTVDVSADRSVPAAELSAAFRSFGAESEPAVDLAALLDRYRYENGNTVLCCAGSLYLIGEIKKIIGGWQSDQF